MIGRKAGVAGQRGWVVNFSSFLKLFLRFLCNPTLHRVAGDDRYCDDLLFTEFCD